MEQRINLTFDKTLVALAGNPFGKKTFFEQVKGKASLDNDVYLVFPDNIERVASSFTQGFFVEWMNTEGVETILEKVHIQSVHENLEQYMKDNLL